MPRYFFHLRTPHGLERDDTGLDFAALEDAYLEACEAIPSLAADALRNRQHPTDYAFHISDASGRTLLDVPFTEMVARPLEAVAPATHGDFMGNMQRAQEIAHSTTLKNREIQDRLTDARKKLSSLKDLLQDLDALNERGAREIEYRESRNATGGRSSGT